ncbi:MAG: glycoside hydrolase family 13 protein [Chloroflexota bacterium]
MSISTPEWVKDAVFYQIFPDRFARSEEAADALPMARREPFDNWGSVPTPYSYQGGNLQGIIDHLDYLRDMGITALYLNPIFSAGSNHRYNTFDYFQIDPILGTNETFDRLLAEAHRRDIRIVLDGVFNHVGRGFYPFAHVMEWGSHSPYVDWFHVQDWPIAPYGPGSANYTGWEGISSLPKLNTDNQQVREFIFDVATFWLNKGIDGWRLDVPYEIDDDSFWQEFRQRCKAINPEAYIVGELWFPAQRWLAGDQFDGQMNYLLTRAVFGYMIGDALDRAQTRPMGYGEMPTLTAVEFGAELDKVFNSLYEAPIVQAQLNMLGSHDTPRLLTLANDDVNTVKLAFLCQMTVPGAPNIYYGDEIGLVGRNDPFCRGAFPWMIRNNGIWT